MTLSPLLKKQDRINKVVVAIAAVFIVYALAFSQIRAGGDAGNVLASATGYALIPLLVGLVAYRGERNKYLKTAQGESEQRNALRKARNRAFVGIIIIYMLWTASIFA